MIRSMTGFGTGRAEWPGGAVTAELRTVNHRYFKATVRLPEGCDAWEAPLLDVLREGIHRGHATLTVSVETAEPPPAVQLDWPRARAYHAALRELRDGLGLPGEVDLRMLASFGDIFRAAAPPAPDVPVETVCAAAREAVRAAVAMREAEGRSLHAHLAELLDRIDEECAAIAARAPERLARERDRLRQTVRELLDGAAVDEERLAREIAFLAERWDIQEELVRLRSHVAQFRAALDAEGEPVGKRLGFWVQEMHREANTIGAKANDAQIAERVVRIKTAIEQMREQVENVE